MDAPSRVWREALALASFCATHPSSDRRDFEYARAAAIKHVEGDGAAFILGHSATQLLRAAPGEIAPYGSQLSLHKATQDQILDWHKTLARGSRTTASIVGNVSIADVCFLVKGRCEMARTISLSTESPQAALSFESSLRQTFASYRALGGEEPTAVYLGGEGSEQPAVVAWIAQILAREVLMLELPAAQNGQNTFSRFARAAALAARAVAPGKHLNLRQGEFSRQRTAHSIRRHMRMIAICAAAVVLSLAFSLYARWSVLNDERIGLEAELAQVTKEVFGAEAKTIEAAKKMVSGTSHADPLPRFDGFDVINALSQRVGPEIKHHVRRLIVDINEETHEGRLELEGDVDTINESDTIAQALEAHECLQDVEKKRTSRQADGTVRYQLDAIIQCKDDSSAKPRRQGRSRSSEVE